MWTDAELVAEAERRGFDLLERKLDDWTGKGLLASPKRRGTGRGSKPAVRSDDQAELLWTLLRNSETASNRIHVLANWPVFIWLHWPSTDIPTAQVRKALHTWADNARKSSLRRSSSSAREIADAIGARRLSKGAVANLAEAISHLASGTLADFDQHRTELADALRGCMTTSPTLALPPAETYLGYVEARYAAIRTFAGDNHQRLVPDTALHEARSLYLGTRSAEMAGGSRPRTAADVEKLDPAGACGHLMTIIGYRLLPSLDRPAT